ncbi:MAG: glycoside hydrolase family 99-like domain-containing protein, partial [Halobaculum sp.]
MIGAHYYGWYGPDNHWSNGYTGTPVLGEYDSKDREVVNRHVEWASQHGIDWFSATWWGPNSYSGRALRNHIAPALAGSPVEYSVLYEPKGRLSFDTDSGTADLDEQHNRERLAADLTQIAEAHTDRSSYLHVDGRPVVYVYIARTLVGDVAGAFAEAQSQAGEQFYFIGDYGRRPQVPNLSVFDAVSPYNMYYPAADINDDFVAYVEDRYRRWRLLADRYDFRFVPNVLPGFDNTEAAWGEEDNPVLYRSPERYRRQCSVARSVMDTDVPMALITSFNEWHEYTSVEPGESFGTTYLEVTEGALDSGPIGGATDSLVPLT